jgi:hypothetical protein
MNVEIGTEAARFPEKEDINGICVALHDTLADFFLRLMYCITKFK